MININKVKTYSVKSRFSKVNASDFAKAPAKRRSFSGFYASLPEILKAKDLRTLADDLVAARRKKKSVIFMAGAHVIKCGLTPVLTELIKQKLITCICLNGAGIIHDFEVAYLGRTSEDVAKSLKDGSFGMAQETAEFIHGAVNAGVPRGAGLGEAVAVAIAREKLPHRNLSLLYQAYTHKVPVCVFVAVGTDIIHQHPSFDAAATGLGSQRDFYRLTEEVKGINAGGVVLNFGSAVIMPEVFLKALNLARNLKGAVKNFTTANFDMIYQYRPGQNIVSRPVMEGGTGYNFVGHHEIMLPLLAQAVMERI